MQKDSLIDDLNVFSASSASSSTQLLNSTLQSVLASLNIQMEDELSRYRRHRLMQRRNPAQPVRGVGATSAAASGDALPAGASVAGSLAGAGQLAQSPEIPDFFSDNAGDMTIAPPAAAPPLADFHAAPDDYLESSEHLLDSLAQEEAEERQKHGAGLLETLLTPLGIGSMLLLILSSATIGYLLINPSVLGVESWRDLFKRGDAASVDSSEAAIASLPEDNLITYPNLAAQEFQDLNLGTLSTLPTAKTPAATSLPTPVAVVPSNPAAPENPASPELALTTNPAPAIVTVQDLPAPESSAPEPAPVSDPPVEAAYVAPPDPVYEEPAAAEPSYAPDTTAESPPAPLQNYYYVVTDYSGDRSLEAAQTVVDDAYVRNFPDEGAQVQLGAFSDESGAQELLQELERQGISAQMYQP